MNNVNIGGGVVISHFTNIYGCELGNEVFVGPFVEIQKNCKIGDHTRVSSHSFICEGVNIGKNCFIGHGVAFVNDKFTENKNEWILRKTEIGDNVRIGSNSTILPVKIGNNVVIGAGSVVTKDIPDNLVVYGNPARVKKSSK